MSEESGDLNILEKAYRGIPIDHLGVMYDALIRKGIDLSSDSTKAFYQGAQYGVHLVEEEIEKTYKEAILYSGKGNFIKGIGGTD